ncbi:MAG: hypothetical protein GY761_12455 [Hyphomicrobiales bacterium]|nr:hypothetical protein [Hyphomicrobiales bacterium]
MTYIFITLLVIVLIGLVLWIFVNSDPRIIARTFQMIIPVTLMVVGIIATIAGRGQYGIPAIGLSLIIWFNVLRRR